MADDACRYKTTTLMTEQEYGPSAGIYIASAIITLLLALLAFSQNDNSKVEAGNVIGVMLLLCGLCFVLFYITAYRKFVLCQNSLQILSFWGVVKAELFYADIEKVLDHRYHQLVNEGSTIQAEREETKMTIILKTGDQETYDVSNIDDTDSLFSGLRACIAASR